ncbi:polysaccharide pyruvyl transferase family protein [Pusillimonas sp.]|uniref:polysaccharide pyruvyl transferase family protein n=1 Tax=Pusillimonas sp. TaxID=3040095 RepID=UPI0037CA91A6
MKQTLFIGEYSSRNVGDGIIKMAMEKLCRQYHLPAAFRDFTGGATKVAAEPSLSGIAPANDRPPAQSIPHRIKSALLRLSVVNYAVAVLFYFTRYRRIAANYRVEEYRQVVIGGGNLLMDNFLNFPLLILCIVRQCERRRVPVKLFSVGAGKSYSWVGRQIMARIVQSDSVESIVCRDGNTYSLIKEIGEEEVDQKIICGFDSGLYLDRCDALVRRTETVGLGVIAPTVLKTVTPDHPMSDTRQAVQWWDALIEELAREVGAERIEIFSNGSAVDNAFARFLWLELSPKYPGLSVFTSVRSSSDLIQRIGSYQALAAYRMHAAVTAMALDVPVVGFEWDPKVLQMFTYCGKRHACIAAVDFHAYLPQDIVATLLEETPARLEPIRRVLERDFRHATNV